MNTGSSVAWLSSSCLHNPGYPAHQRESANLANMGWQFRVTVNSIEQVSNAFHFTDITRNQKTSGISPLHRHWVALCQSVLFYFNSTNQLFILINFTMDTELHCDDLYYYNKIWSIFYFALFYFHLCMHIELQCVDLYYFILIAQIYIYFILLLLYRQYIMQLETCFRKKRWSLSIINELSCV